VQLHSQQRQRFARPRFEVSVEGHGAGVHHRHRPGADDFELLALHDHRGVFVDADPEMVRVARHRGEQSTDPTPLREVLVDDDAGDEIESRPHRDCSRTGTDEGGAADDHRARHRRRAGAGAADHPARRMEPPQSHVRRRAA
jgi:hypothetical protein